MMEIKKQYRATAVTVAESEVKDMYEVVRFDYKKEECEVLFENESYLECEWYLDELEDKTNVEIVEPY